MYSWTSWSTFAIFTVIIFVHVFHVLSNIMMKDLTVNVFAPPGICSDVKVFTDLSNDVGEYNVAIFNWNDGQNYENKAHVLINAQ